MMLKRILLIPLLFLYPLLAQASLFPYQDKKTELWGFKNAKGVVKIPPQFSRVYFSNKEVFSPKNKETEYLVGVCKNCKLYRITRDGKVKFESVFFDNGPDYYEEGLARFIDPKTGKAGFHDMKGHVVIKPEFDFAAPFSNGVANVCNGCHAEYPAKPTYAPLSSSSYKILKHDMYLSIEGGKWGMIDKTGKILVPLHYDSYDKMKKSQ